MRLALKYRYSTSWKLITSRYGTSPADTSSIHKAVITFIKRQAHMLPARVWRARSVARALAGARRHKWTPPPLPGTARPSVDPAADRVAAQHFVQERGYSKEIAIAVVESLAKPEWGAGTGGLLTLSKRLAGRWEVGEDAGLHSLAKAVEREMSAAAGLETVTFSVVPARGEAFACEAYEGMSLKDVAEFGEGLGADLLAEHLECACSGVMACSTCHVHIDPEWFGEVGAPSEEEEDMLDLAFDRRDQSRLGCQLKLNPKLGGLVVRLPSDANNLFDHIPFAD